MSKMDWFGQYKSSPEEIVAVAVKAEAQAGGSRRRRRGSRKSKRRGGSRRRKHRTRRH
jgi:hypothetical protein